MLRSYLIKHNKQKSETAKLSEFDEKINQGQAPLPIMSSIFLRLNEIASVYNGRLW